MAVFCATYHGYTYETALQMPYRQFWAMCPSLASYAEEKREDTIAAARAKVVAMRAWREERARRIAERQAGG